MEKVPKITFWQSIEKTITYIDFYTLITYTSYINCAYASWIKHYIMYTFLEVIRVRPQPSKLLVRFLINFVKFLRTLIL